MEGDTATTAIWELEIFGASPVEDNRATTATWELEVTTPSGDLRWQLENDRATTAIWKLESFGGRSSWKVTRRQLQSRNSRFLVACPAGKRQGYNCNLGTRDFLVVGTAI